ncbi:DHA2 family efflux MFS transporter permease subunit [Fodinicola acaciae]|uniref:DHA2 family efflux MFS transporter permease subunit n=1 Tax=Fodinicola acaciae TaxID=2681555 RepID=UPI0013D2F0F0|nr:DHA2 family efflux MFS transporter permease subunit [Fodinicola acaciae]
MSERTTTTATQRWTLALAAVGSFMVVLDLLVVATALTAIQRDLHASLESLEWTVNAYTVSFAVLLLTTSAIGDRIGRRRVFIAGLALFALASAGCAVAPDVGWLIGLRAVQGVGAAAVMPMALTLLNAAFPPERRGWATGIYGSVTAIGVLLGPALGGAITQGIAWPWIFWLNVPIALLAIPLVFRHVKESTAPARPDPVGLALGGLAVLGVIWALVRATAAGWGSAEVVTGLGGGVVLGIAFVAWERRTIAPMLPMRLFASRAFSAGSTAVFFLNATATGAIFLTAQFLQAVQGNNPLEAGLQLLPWGVAPVAIAPFAGALADRFGERRLVVAGLFVEVIGIGWLAAIATPSVGYPPLAGALTLSGVGFALAMPAVTKAVVSLVAPADIAKASGTFSTMRQLGGAFGVAVAGAVFAATGTLANPAGFTKGFVAAMLAAAAIALAGALAALGLHRHRATVSASPAPRAAAGFPAPDGKSDREPAAARRTAPPRNSAE